MEEARDMRCKAKAKQTGERCKRPAAKGKEVCYMHGAKAGAPTENANARTHGAYETLIRERLSEEDRQAFDAVPDTTSLSDELRILRYKMLRLLGDVEQNVVAGFSVERIMADEPTKVSGIVQLADAIRKVVKEMEGSGEDDPLARLAQSWEVGMRSEGKEIDTRSLREAE